MKLRRVLGGLVKAAGPAALGFATAGPGGAGAALLAQGAAALEKRRGKAAEQTAGAPPVHKLTAPTAAVAAPTVVVAILAAFGIDSAGELGGVLCGSPTAAAAIVGIEAVFAHQVGTGLARFGTRRSPG